MKIAYIYTIFCVLLCSCKTSTTIRNVFDGDEIFIESVSKEDQETFLYLAHDENLYVMSGFCVRKLYNKDNHGYNNIQDFKDSIRLGKICLNISKCSATKVRLDKDIKKEYDTYGIQALLHYCKPLEGHAGLLKINLESLDQTLSIAYFFYINGYEYSYSDVGGVHVVEKSVR